MAAEPSPYQILGIPVGANEKEIRKAYRRLAMKYHPDRNPGDTEAEGKFKRVQRAYETLSGGKGVMDTHRVPASPGEFDAPFSVSSDPFSHFYMAARKHFSELCEKEPASKKKPERDPKR